MPTLNLDVSAYVRRRASTKPSRRDAARAAAARTFPFEVLEIANRLYPVLDQLLSISPNHALEIVRAFERCDHELHVKAEQLFHCHPETRDKVPGPEYMRLRWAQVAAGLALTTHLLIMLNGPIKRARRKVQRRAKATQP